VLPSENCSSTLPLRAPSEKKPRGRSQREREGEWENKAIDFTENKLVNKLDLNIFSFF
jgi:hypothetical protein